MAGPIALSTRDRESLSVAANHFAAGRYRDTVAIARDLSTRLPAFGPAYKLLGSALHMLGSSAEAVAALRAAARLLPEDAQTLTNLGNALAAIGRDDESVDVHRQAIALSPDAATPRYNFGCVLLQQQRRAEALDEFWRAYEAAPGDGDLARLCRELVLELNDPARAIRFCRLNLDHLPDDAGAAGMLGALLLDDPAADKDEAEAMLRLAVRLAPDDAVSWSNLCVVLRQRARFADAIAAGERAAELAPQWALAHNNLGTALRDAGAWEEAKAAYLRALACDGECVDAYYNLGCVCGDLGAHETAREAYIEALKRSPRPEWLLQGAHACRQVLDWQGAELLEDELARQLADDGSLSAAIGHRPSPFAYLTTPGAGATAQRRIACHFAAQFADRAALPARLVPRHDGRLRIGLLSSDFRDHATAHLLTGVLEVLDRKRFQLIAYDYSPPADDDYRRRLLRAIPDWVPVAGLSDLEAAQRMQADGVDIAIDLKGWTQGYRSGILAHRPAPVQMQWLGYPGTLGAPWMDYIIGDKVVIPAGAEAGYSEKVLRLPGSYQPNDGHRVIGPRLPRAALGLPEHALVLAAFHQPYKITRSTVDLWLRLLAYRPDSVLWLLDAPPMAKDALHQAAVAADIDPVRLVWAPRMAASDHLGRLAAADLALDVFPVNAHTTASDALWVGVPQVARCGDSFVSRVSASIVSAAGMPELVAGTDADYEALVMNLIDDRARLAVLREGLAARRPRCPLFDAGAFARHLGVGLQLAWSRHAAGLGPDHITVTT